MFNIFGKQKKVTATNNPNAIRPMVLLSIDGFGIAPPSAGNAVTLAKTPNYDYYRSQYPNGQLIASGESVGLPANEEGNSEVGHLMMGSGTVILQSLMRVNKSIEEGEFFENQAFERAVNHVKSNNSKLHILGLVGTGEVHSAIGHFYALLEYCKRKELDNVVIHLITDGRDAPPKEAVEIMEQIEARLKDLKVGNIATVAGRYYAMDRDRRWERTQRAYDALVLGQGLQANSATEAVKMSYEKGQTDEFVEPTVIMQDGKPVGTVDDDDAVIFFNFRIDRPRQLTMAFVLDNFENLQNFEFGHDPYQDKYTAKNEKQVVSGPTFRRQKVAKNVYFVTMTEYQEGLPVSAIAFPPEIAEYPLPRVLAENNLSQMRIAESEKERMVTFYFNGMIEEDVPNTDVIIVPSPKVATYDLKPEMSVFDVTKKFRESVEANKYHFFMMNFANTDMVAHTGNLKASIKAVEFADKGMAEVVDTTLAYNGTVLITADHGNVEELIKYPSSGFYYTTAQGVVDTSHSNNPVPVLIISNQLAGKPIQLSGSLVDVAPTILSIMNLPVPPTWTGKNLLGEHPGS